MKYLIWLVLLIILVYGGYLLLSSSNDSAPIEGADSAMPANENSAVNETTVENGTEQTTTKGSYEVYAPEKISRASSGDVVLFFRAVWCPTCKALDADIRANLSSIPGGLTILDVDYDNSAELKKKYGVTYQHTFVQVDAQGKLIKKWSGSPTLLKLVAEVI